MNFDFKGGIARMLGLDYSKRAAALAGQTADTQQAADVSQRAALMDEVAKAADDNPQTAHVRHLQREFERHPARGLTPARLQAILVNAEQGDLLGQLDLADDMEERDAHLYAELAKRRGAVSALPWTIEAPDDASEQEKSLTAAVKEWIQQVQVAADGVTGSFDLAIRAMTDGILKGFAPLEMVWAMHGKVRVPNLTAQPQRWFTPSADRRRLLLRSLAATEGTPDLPSVQGEELWPLSWLMHMHPARSGYVSRMSLARVLAWPYLFKNYSVRDLAEFLEIYGLPLRVGKYPAGASDDEKRRLLQAVVQIGHNAAGIIPASMELEFQAAAAGTEVPFAAMWDRMDAAESKAILGQTLTASEGKNGTQALGNVHNEVRHDIRNADARLIESSVSSQLIRPMALLNFAGAESLRMPKLKIDTGEPEDLALFAEALPALARAGLQIPVDWAQGKLRIPKPAEGEEVMTGAAPDAGAPTDPTANDPGPARKPPKPPLRAALSGLAATGATVDELDLVIDDALADWQPLMQPLVAPLLAELDRAVQAGESLEAFRARLPDLVDAMDATPLGDSLAKAAFIAQLAGLAGVNPASQGDR